MKISKRFGYIDTHHLFKGSIELLNISDQYIQHNYLISKLYTKFPNKLILSKFTNLKKLIIKMSSKYISNKQEMIQIRIDNNNIQYLNINGNILKNSSSHFGLHLTNAVNLSELYITNVQRLILFFKNIKFNCITINHLKYLHIINKSNLINTKYLILKNSPFEIIINFNYQLIKFLAIISDELYSIESINFVTNLQFLNLQHLRLDLDLSCIDDITRFHT